MLPRAAFALLRRYRALPAAYLQHFAGDVARAAEALGIGEAWRGRVVAAAELDGRERVLVMGAGLGSVALTCKRAHPSVSLELVEPRPDLLGVARGQAAAWGAELQTHAAPLAAVPLENGLFDAIFLSFQLSTASREEGDARLAEAARLLRSMGVLVVSDLAVGRAAERLPARLAARLAPMSLPLGAELPARLAAVGLDDTREALRWRGVVGTFVARRRPASEI